MLISVVAYLYVVGAVATALFVASAMEGRTELRHPFRAVLFVMGWPATVPVVFVGAVLS